MSARKVKGDSRFAFPFKVATAQAVETFDAVALVGNTIVRAADSAWGTVVATPAAPTVANGAVAVGSPLTNALTGVKVSVQFAWGEGALSAAGTGTPTAGALLKVTLAALPTNGLYWNVYVETAAGSGTYQLYDTSPSGAILMVASYGTGRVPPTAVATTATEVSQYTFAQAFAGISNQRKLANVARVTGNSADNTIMVNRGGIFEFDCAAATFNMGDYLGMAKDTGNALLNQTVVAVADQSLAIGRVVKDYAANTTKVVGEILSNYTADRPQAAMIGDLQV